MIKAGVHLKAKTIRKFINKSISWYFEKTNSKFNWKISNTAKQNTKKKEMYNTRNNFGLEEAQ